MTDSLARPVRAIAGAAREQDDGVLVAPLRKPHPPRRPDLVSDSRLLLNAQILTADDDRYMNDSVIVEAGTHDELLAAGGRYKRIYEAQFAPTE